MTKVDQFESAFRAASRPIYHYQSVEVDSVLVVTDQIQEDAEEFRNRISSYLSVLGRGENIRWQVVAGSDFDSVPSLLERIEAFKPGFVCTYRHLHSESLKWPYTLGEYIDVLTQATTTPIMVFPHPESPGFHKVLRRENRGVMAVTDHLVGDERLVNYAVRFTPEGGKLFLTHVEDDAIFERYMETISKISSIDTDDARAKIRTRLLKEPADYVAACARGVRDAGLEIEVEEIVTMGHHLSEYRQLLEDRGIDLLIFNTKDEDQFAMHGLAYPLAVEIRDVPLLML